MDDIRVDILSKVEDASVSLDLIQQRLSSHTPDGASVEKEDIRATMMSRFDDSHENIYSLISGRTADDTSGEKNRYII